MADDDRTGRARIGRNALQCTDPLSRQLTEFHAHLRCRSRDRVVVPSLDAHEPRRLSGPESEREGRSQRHRHLSDELTHAAPADDAVDPVDNRDSLQAALEHREQHPLVPRVHRVLARHEPDIRRKPGKPLALDRAKPGKDRDAGNLLHRHHESLVLSPPP
jgi:hypothetical protein